MTVRKICSLFLVVILLLSPACAGPDERAAAPGAPTETVSPAAGASPTVEETPLGGDSALSPITYPPEGTDGYPWWNDTVWYQIFVRSYYDSTGDGIGDLQGLIQKLDYLNDGDPSTTNDLGITGIWLMPIMASPSYHGYDVTDYYTVNPDYGTTEDFRALVEAAHERGIRVIVDMVLNHTSSEHPWFQAALQNDPEYADWYVFTEEEERPRQRSPWGGGHVWHPAGEPNEYYYGLFWSEMPDLNYRNPEVTEEVKRIGRFWLEEMGADGFRLDGIQYLIEEGRVLKHTDGTQEWLSTYHEFAKSIRSDALLLGEVWDDPDVVVPYIGERLDIAFEFNTAESLLSAARQENAGPVRIAYGINGNLYPPLQYAPFITNHDQNRAFSQLDEDIDHMRTAAAILLTGPGSPFIYYGEEVAMTGTKPDENIRRPMPWNGEANAGFTDASRSWHEFSDGYEERNVAAMQADPDSLLNHYRRFIHLRNGNPALRVGDYLVLRSTDDRIFPFIRQSKEQTVLVLHNLSSEPIQDYQLGLEEGAKVAANAPVELLHGVEVASLEVNEQGGFQGYRPVAELAPYSSYVIQLRP